MKPRTILKMLKFHVSICILNNVELFHLFPSCLFYHFKNKFLYKTIYMKMGLQCAVEIHFLISGFVLIVTQVKPTRIQLILVATTPQQM